MMDERGGILHSVYQILDRTQSAWTADQNQRAARTRLLAKALAEAGMLLDAEIRNDMVYVAKKGGPT